MKSVISCFYSAIPCEQKSKFLLLGLEVKLGKTGHMVGQKSPTTKSVTGPDGMWGSKTSKERLGFSEQRGGGWLVVEWETDQPVHWW